MSRKETTAILTRAVSLYLIDRRYSVHQEIGIKNRRRLDILSLNYKGHIIGVEVKSCIEDYRADQKWRSYLPYVNKLYFCFPIEMWEKHKERLKTEIGKDAGVMVVETTANGFVRTKIVKSVNESPVESTVLLQNCIKMAWRGGQSVADHMRRASKRMTIDDPFAEHKKRKGVKAKNHSHPVSLLKLYWKGIKR